MKTSRDANIVLKMPKNVSIYYFGGLATSLLVGIVLLLMPTIRPQITTEWANITLSIGASIVAGAIVGGFAFAGTLVTRSLQEDEALLKTIRDIGITGYFSKRYLTDEYEKYSSDAKQFDLLGYGLGRFRKDMKSEFEGWAATKKMRILVINPSSSIATQRDREENDTIGKIAQESHELTMDILDIAYRNRIRDPVIKWYTAIPTVNIMRLDAVMYIGPYFVGKTSGASITLKLEQNTALFSLFERHFDDIWKSEDLSVDPSFLKELPRLLDLKRRYFDHKAFFLIGGSCSGKTTALEVARSDGYATVDWSDVLKDFFEQEGTQTTDFNIRETLRNKGLHFFPHLVMRKLLANYIDIGDACKGFVVAGARNIRELCYLATFFDKRRIKVACILANDDIRCRRYAQRTGKTTSMTEFLGKDDARIIHDIQEDAVGETLIHNLVTISNESDSLEAFTTEIRGLLGDR